MCTIVPALVNGAVQAIVASWSSGPISGRGVAGVDLAKIVLIWSFFGIDALALYALRNQTAIVVWTVLVCGHPLSIHTNFLHARKLNESVGKICFDALSLLTILYALVRDTFVAF